MRARSRTTPFVCSCCKISASRCNVANNFPSLTGTQISAIGRRAWADVRRARRRSSTPNCGLRIADCGFAAVRIECGYRSRTLARNTTGSGSKSALLNTKITRLRSGLPVPIRNPQFAIRMARVDHVQDEVRLLRLFDRCAERGDEVMRQLANEPNGIGHSKPVAVADVHLARECVEGREQSILDEHIRA